MLLSHLQESAQGVRGDGGSFVYLFETPEGSLLYQDTSGHWSGILHNLRPDVPSWLRLVAAPLMVSPFRVCSPSSWRGRPICCAPGA